MNGELQITTDRKNPGVTFWATVAVAVGLHYPISFGPACWISSRYKRGTDVVSRVYQPILKARFDATPGVGRIISGYAKLFSAQPWSICRYGTGYCEWHQTPIARYIPTLDPPET